MALDAQRPVVTNHFCPVMPPRERPTGQELGAFRTREPAQEARGNFSGKPPLSSTSYSQNSHISQIFLGFALIGVTKRRAGKRFTARNLKGDMSSFPYAAGASGRATREL